MSTDTLTARDTTSAYEASSGPLCTIEVPYDRLTDTPVIHKPAQVLPVGIAGASVAVCLTGTIITLDAGADTTTSVAVINVARGACYYHRVRNVSAYSAGAEGTWPQINFGMPVYYDHSHTMPSGCFLSLAVSDASGMLNTLFGYCVWGQLDIPDPFRGDSDIYPLGTSAQRETGTTFLAIPVMQK